MRAKKMHFTRAIHAIREATALARAVGALVKGLQTANRAKPLADVWPGVEPYFKPFPAFNEYFGDYLEKDKEKHLWDRVRVHG